MAKAYKEGKGWSQRTRYQGHDIYVSGKKTEAAAQKETRARLTAIDKNAVPAGRGPHQTTLAQALQNYALDRLPFLKGAVQEAVRMNKYLRDARLATLVVTRCAPEGQNQNQDPEDDDGAYFKVTLAPYSAQRSIPNGLGAHRAVQLTENARTEKHRAIIAGKTMSRVTRQDLQALVYAMRRDRNSPATIQLERAMLRVLFNHAFSFWRWTDLADNPATMLKMPQARNGRDRVLSLAEQTLLDAALSDCRNSLVAPVIVLLRETAMRSSEPLETAKWGDVDWARKMLHLTDAKAGGRDVPLSPLALQTLRELGPDDAHLPIVQISYESLKAGFKRACERAGLENLQLHDLRHTAATRMALKTGNVWLVKALTGHKSNVSVERYVNVKACDVVDVMHAPDTAPAAPAEPQMVTLAAMEEGIQTAVRAALDAVRPAAVQPVTPENGTNVYAFRRSA
ncbi:MAG: site-specific integrase [Pseudomonadota bacterium]|nr:site-specific integrase [Pseudomonadota bacterium]